MRVFMRQAKARYVLIVHQDAIPLESVTELLRLVDLVEEHDPDWGMIGNCGRQFAGDMDFLQKFQMLYSGPKFVWSRLNYIDI